MNIRKWIIDRIKKTNCRDPRSDKGLIIIPKNNFLKKHKNVKRYNVVVYGDTVEELYKNFKTIELDLLMMQAIPIWEAIN